MSEGLQNSRSQKLGLDSIADQVADTQSQNDFGALKKQQHNITVDSGGPQTVSGGGATKASKHDTTNLSASDYNYT